jgi:hypothetical protein
VESKEAQDIVGNEIISANKKAALEVQQLYPDANLNINKLVYLSHWLGKGGMKDYIKNAIEKGIEYADEVTFERTNVNGQVNRKVSEGLKKFAERQKKYYSQS